MASTNAARELLERYEIEWKRQSLHVAMSTIHVDEIAAKLAAFYEKIRNIIDYQEEHLLRKNTMLRTLQRRLLLSQSGNIAEGFVKEIIRGGQLKNNSVPETKIGEVQQIIDQHLRLVHEHKGAHGGENEEYAQWLFELAANAIEDVLFPSMREGLLAGVMVETLRENIHFNGKSEDDIDLEVHLMIAVQRALFRVDDDQLMYRVARIIYPGFVGVDLRAVRSLIKKTMKSPLQRAIFRLAKQYDTVFLLIGDIIDETKDVAHLRVTFEHEELLREAALHAYEKRFTREKGRLYRLAFFTVLSFLLSKIAIALAIEIPLEKLVTHNFSLGNTIINVVTPPLLMLVIVSFIRMPGVENRKRAIEEVLRVAYEEKRKEYVLKREKKRGIVATIIINLLYAGLFVLVFWLLSKILVELQFSAANMIVFALFISLVAAAGVKIHNRAQELSLEPQEATVVGFIIDLFTIPLVTIGKWIIEGLAQFNILVLLMNLVIELPLQFIVEFLENFRSFIQSKKDEIR